MSSSKRKRREAFLELYLEGKSLPEDIDDYVDAWHENPLGLEIYEFLGMSEDEYALWVRDPAMLPHIARSRVEQLPLSKAVKSALKEMRIAARSSDSHKVRRLVTWLERLGKLD